MRDDQTEHAEPCESSNSGDSSASMVYLAVESQIAGGTKQCRVCWDAGEPRNLISPCSCKGIDSHHNFGNLGPQMPFRIRRMKLLVANFIAPSRCILTMHDVVVLAISFEFFSMIAYNFARVKMLNLY